MILVRSGPDNPNSRWHIRRPNSRSGRGVLCGNSVSGPTVDGLAGVTGGPTPLCSNCANRRTDMIADALALLRGLS